MLATSQLHTESPNAKCAFHCEVQGADLCSGFNCGDAGKAKGEAIHNRGVRFEHPMLSLGFAAVLQNTTEAYK